jgi:hypothetical protein
MTLLPLELPPTDKSQGKTLYVVHDTPPAGDDGIPTFAEVNAALFAGCYFYGDLDLAVTQNTGEGPRKACATIVQTEEGNTNFPAIEVQYSYKAQLLGTPGSEGNELYEALEPGTEVTMSVFYALDGRLPEIPDGAIGDVVRVKCLRRRKTRTGDGEFDQHSITQLLIPQGGDFVVEDHEFNDES